MDDVAYVRTSPGFADYGGEDAHNILDDLLDKVEGSDLPIKPIEQIKEEVEALVGGAPEPPRLGDDPVAVIKWVDGTVIDTVWQVEQ